MPLTGMATQTLPELREQRHRTPTVIEVSDGKGRTRVYAGIGLDRGALLGGLAATRSPAGSP
jgi:hypothetical protein